MIYSVAPTFQAKLGVRKAQRQAVSVRAAERALWNPGSTPPAHLDGSLPGDFGFDPLNLGEEKSQLAWYQQAELVHGRLAMTAISGILFPSLQSELSGGSFPQWYEAGFKYIQEDGAVPFNTLIVIQIAMTNYVEVKRWEDYKNPGSQADGSVLGITDGFKGVSNGYPGGVFDPMGFSKKSPEALAKWQKREVINGRLAMLSIIGYFAQWFATDAGPVQNLKAHIADPGHVNFVNNGVSLPFLFGQV